VRAFDLTLLAAYSSSHPQSDHPAPRGAAGPGQINAGINLFVSIRTSQHSEAWATKFCRAAAQIPEVIEFYRMTGDVDYLLRVVVPNIAAYDDFYKRLIKTGELSDVSSSFAMETIKYTTALPLEYVNVQKSSAEAEPTGQVTKRVRPKRSRNANRL
jgi:DNA-binding Lrp family transcriptional regulator